MPHILRREADYFQSLGRRVTAISSETHSCASGFNLEKLTAFAKTHPSHPQEPVANLCETGAYGKDSMGFRGKASRGGGPVCNPPLKLNVFALY